jgi:hypothetical protein
LYAFATVKKAVAAPATTDSVAAISRLVCGVRVEKIDPTPVAFLPWSVWVGWILVALRVARVCKA